MRLFLDTGNGVLIGYVELTKQRGFMIAIPDVNPVNKCWNSSATGDGDGV